MTRETKIGIVMVLVLVGVFGFLVYKRAMRPGEVLAQTEAVDEENPDLSPDDADSDASLLPKEFADLDEEEPASKEILTVGAKTRPIPQAEPEENVSNPFGDEDPEPTKTRPSQPKLLALPEEKTQEPDEAESESFGDEQPSGSVPELAANVSSGEPVVDDSDPFMEKPAQTSTEVSDEPADEPAMEAPVIAETTAPALGFDTSESNDEESFGNEETVEEATEEPVMVAPVKERPIAKAPVKSFEIPAEEPEEVSFSARATIPDRALDFGEEAVAEPAADTVMEPEPETEVTEVESQPLPRRVEQPVVSEPAPELMLDDSSDEDRYGDYEPIELAEANDAEPFGSANVRSDVSRGGGVEKTLASITGDRHVVQSGESFWSISQQKYGTGRYFQALAAHNQKAVPDAGKMKLGVEISLPPAEELERRYPTLFSATGPKEPAAAAGNVQVRGEYMVNAGQPLYRIGTGDTLSDIAQRYLGRSRRWEQILVMNRDILKDGNSLKVGAVLRLPSDATQLQLSNQTREFR